MNRQIWFDLTTSMQWGGGIVGIVRAELEIAVNLKKINKDIKFSVEEHGHFREVTVEELAWLLNASNITEAYLNQKGKRPISANIENSINSLRYSGSGRSKRFKDAFFLMLSVCPQWLQGIGLILSYLPIKLINILSYLYARLNFKSSRKILTQSQKLLTVQSPYIDGDIILSVGWMDSNKEKLFTKVKKDKDIKIVYLIYDLILINEQTKHFYPKEGSKKFNQYFRWVSNHCDFVLYGGEVAKKDAHAFQKTHHYTIPEGKGIKFGSDIIRNDHINEDVDKKILAGLGIRRNYILTVGTIEVRKNHDVLYKAYALLSERQEGDIPLLVIVGKQGWRAKDVVDNMTRDPRVAGNIMMISPTDVELDCLYRHCLFTVLPSLYEGWSLTLPESFGYNKFCLCADVPPLREIGEGIADFIDPLTPFEWADKIAFYSKNLGEVYQKEAIIKNKWNNITWFDCAQDINQIITTLDFSISPPQKSNAIWFDMTTSYIMYRGGISGIIRTELMLAKELYYSGYNVIYYAIDHSGFFEINQDKLALIFEAATIEEGFAAFQDYWKKNPNEFRVPIASEVVTERGVFPELQDAYDVSHSRRQRIVQGVLLMLSVFPIKFSNFIVRHIFSYGKKFANRVNGDIFEADLNSTVDNSLQDLPFNKNDIVLSVGLDWSLVSLKAIKLSKAVKDFKYCSIIYDLTPVNYPQLHSEQNSKRYHKFLELNTEISDMILYGGQTAMDDGIQYQNKFGWTVPFSLPIRFGSDISYSNDLKRITNNDEQILSDLGINRNFIIAVGTLEIRKNHESLYKAYLKLIERREQALPLLIFIGHKGWKIDDFLDSFDEDERIKGKIIRLSPSDEQLNVLYRHCLFTVLASQYEGWSLTLPESLTYGKFCLVSDVKPLREVGGDLVDYIHPWDIEGWANKIMFYAQNHQILLEKEERIKQSWKKITWHDFYLDVMNKLENFQKAQINE
ncbi:glycosyltransferase [Neisseria sp. Ec49-e6-T10]|uniref:glycosyltransferase n=1 Tax=Neisseria sp. Ec49-e6-T10 TaxID=3140744 RepID=UPI003EBE09C7